MKIKTYFHAFVGVGVGTSDTVGKCIMPIRSKLVIVVALVEMPVDF